MPADDENDVETDALVEVIVFVVPEEIKVFWAAPAEVVVNAFTVSVADAASIASARIAHVVEVPIV